MNIKQLTLLLVLVIILGGAGLALYKKDTAAWQASASGADRTLLAEFPLNDVTHIRIQDAADEVNLVRKDDLWTVRERSHYPADFSEISRFLRNVWELKAVQDVAVGASQLHRLDLQEPGQGDHSGTLVEFLDDEGRRINGLLLGKQHMTESASPSPFGGDNRFPAGRYILVMDGSNRVALISDPLSNVQPRADRWVNKDFIRVDGIRAVAVRPREGAPWKVFRETQTGAWQLADAQDGEQLDTSKVSPFNHSLSRPSFTDVVVDPAPEITGMDNPAVATVETFDGLVYTLHVGTPDESNYYLRVSVNADFPEPEEGEEDPRQAAREKLQQEQQYANWTYGVSKWTVEALLRDRAGILAAKQDGDAAEPPEPDDLEFDGNLFDLDSLLNPGG